MTTFAESLKKEIARVARKELREEIAALRKILGLQRSDIAALKKHVQALQVQAKKLDKARAAPVRATSEKVAPVSGGTSKGKPGRKVTFTAERLKTQRARLGFTQEQMAKLLEVSSLSIWKWESGGATPRAARIPQILQRLALSKREAQALVASEGD
ncbi:MAG: XRE family transcriptional regulator [Comamonadaceae bacterium]|nr:MAG: XRE family transcriptional regulator [Comamonadaceae bacterium]